MRRGLQLQGFYISVRALREPRRSPAAALRRGDRAERLRGGGGGWSPQDREITALDEGGPV